MAIKLKPKPYKNKDKGLTIHETAIKYGRPQSPHLSIYAPQLTSMLSITHRFSGKIYIS